VLSTTYLERGGMLRLVVGCFLGLLGCWVWGLVLLVGWSDKI